MFYSIKFYDVYLFLVKYANAKIHINILKCTVHNDTINSASKDNNKVDWKHICEREVR